MLCGLPQLTNSPTHNSNSVVHKSYTYPVNTTVWVSLTLVLLSTTRAARSQPGRLFKAGGLIACDGERARRTRRRWRATAARARERARERRRRGAPRCSGLCAARLWLSAGAAAPGLAVGAGAGGLSRAQKRKAQRDKPLDQAQRDGALDGRSRAGQDRLCVAMGHGQNRNRWYLPEKRTPTCGQDVSVS